MTKLRWIILSLAFLLVAGALFAYWQYQERHPSTSDAYVNANVVRIAAQVGGPLTQVYVSDHQRVHTGEPLFDIDPAVFTLAVAQAQAQLRLAEQTVAANRAAVAAADAQLHVQQAQRVEAQRDFQRIQALVRKGDASAAQLDAANARLKSVLAQQDAAQAILEQARRTLGEDGADNAGIRAAQANLSRAQLDLQHSHVRAPADGRIADFNLRKGTTVEANVPLFALVETRGHWVQANYKETDLQTLRPGQPAQIRVDMFPSTVLHGQVQSISPASGASFSLLPPENATGNWVKVTQRFPVNIRIDDSPQARMLPLGASAQVVIDTTAPLKHSDASNTPAAPKDGT